MMKRSSLPLGILLGTGLTGIAGAQTNVFLNYTNFDARLDEVFAARGVALMNATERANMRTGIQTRLASIYSGYTVNFTTTAPTSGNYERLTFGQTTTSTGLYGEADRIDWRNAFKNDTADIYTRNFGEFISSGFDRATNLTRMMNSLSRTAAHELGHNVGLSHYDAYGYGQLNSGNGYTTSGQQNPFFMGTGATGANTTDRVGPALVNDLMATKLQYADGLSPDLGLTIPETVAVNDAIANAQPLSFKTLPLTNLPSVNIEGTMTANDVDFFSFTSLAGSLITANVMASNGGLPGGGSVDSVLTLYDSAGNALFQNDDYGFSGNTFYSSANFGRDSIILNFVAPTTGTYYLGMSGFNASSVGNYNILVTPVPEPATFAVIGIGALLLRRRRSR